MALPRSSRLNVFPIGQIIATGRLCGTTEKRGRKTLPAGCAGSCARLVRAKATPRSTAAVASNAREFRLAAPDRFGPLTVVFERASSGPINAIFFEHGRQEFRQPAQAMRSRRRSHPRTGLIHSPHRNSPRAVSVLDVQLSVRNYIRMSTGQVRSLCPRELTAVRTSPSLKPTPRCPRWRTVRSSGCH